MATRIRVSADDLWRMPSGDVRRELVNGEIVEMAPAGGLHGHYVTEIASRLREHVRRYDSGFVVSGDVGFVLHLSSDPERVRAPDVAFVGTARLPDGRLPRTFLHCAPDLAIEVLSPGDRPIDVEHKVRDYLEAGSRLVWIVAPEADTVTVFRAGGPAQLLRKQDSLDGEDVLPGLRLPLSEFFKSEGPG